MDLHHNTTNWPPGHQLHQVACYSFYCYWTMAVEANVLVRCLPDKPQYLPSTTTRKQLKGIFFVTGKGSEIWTVGLQSTASKKLAFVKWELLTECYPDSKRTVKTSIVRRTLASCWNKENLDVNRGKWKGWQLPGIEPRTHGFCSQCSATELRQPDNH